MIETSNKETPLQKALAAFNAQYHEMEIQQLNTK